jgi:hypothetical protein
VVDKRGDPFVPARFDDAQIQDDLSYLPVDAADALRALRREIDRDDGIPASRLKHCDEEGRDGTHLAGRLKTYVPWPIGRYGIVFQIVGHATRPWGVRVIAYGIRHKPGRGRLTVYEVADRRLPEIVAEDLRGKKPDTPGAGGDDTPEG